MKKLLTNNIGMKLLSILIAIIIWFIVINMEDPVERKTFYGIPVALMNQEEVTDRDKIIEVVKGDTVDVIVEGKRSELEELKVKDFVATADLTEISLWDTVMVKVDVPEYPKVKVVNNAQSVVKLIFDDYITKPFTFHIKTAGQPMVNYVIGESYASPNIIQISGAKTVLERIKEVVLNVDVEGKNSDFTTKAVPLVYDLNGELIDSSKLTMMDSVSVSVPVLSTKNLKVRVDTIGTLPEGYEILTENILYPETVRIAGTKEELARMGAFLPIEIDVTGQKGVIEKNINVLDLFDDSYESLRTVDMTTVAVTVTITPFVDKPLEVSSEVIERRGLAETLDIQFTQTNVILRMKCRSARSPFLTYTSVNPYVDLTGLTAGTYHLEVQYELVPGIIVGTPTFVDVIISEKDPEEPLVEEHAGEE